MWNVSDGLGLSLFTSFWIDKKREKEKPWDYLEVFYSGAPAVDFEKESAFFDRGKTGLTI